MYFSRTTNVKTDEQKIYNVKMDTSLLNRHGERLKKKRAHTYAIVVMT